MGWKAFLTALFAAFAKALEAWKYERGRKDAQAAMRQAQLRKELDRVLEGEKIDRAVDRMSDDDVVKRLHERGL